MNLPPPVVAHGEKALVLLVFIGCIYWVYSTFTDPEITPSMDAAEVTQKLDKITAAAVRDVDPLLNQPPDRLTRIQKRFGVNLRGKPVMAWLMQHVTWGKKGRVNTQPYIYEVDQPTVSVEGTLGRLVAKIRTPTPNRTSNPRVADTPLKDWTREGTRQGRVKNGARWVGIFVERKAANEDWQPLEGKGITNGFLPLSLGSGGGEYEVVNEDVKEWWTYRYRARLLVKATGWTAEQGGKSDYGEEVLVVTDASPYRLTSVEDSEVLGHKIAQHFSGAEEGLANLATPYEGAPPTGVEIDEEEKLYLGGWSEVVLQRAPSSIKLALMRAMPPVMQGGKPSAKVLLKKRIQDLDGNYHWTPVQEFTVKLGEKVGGEKTLILPEIYRDDRRVKIDFSTPFVLEKIDDQAERVIAYEVKVDSSQKPERLKLRERTKVSDRAFFKNTITGETLTRVELERTIRLRPENDRFKVYPRYSDNQYAERAAFEADPEAFKQPGLDLPPVLWRDPVEDFAWLVAKCEEAGELPPQELQSPYLILPDQRVLYLDPLNPRQIFTFAVPGGAAELFEEARRKAEERPEDGEGGAESGGDEAGDGADDKPDLPTLGSP